MRQLIQMFIFDMKMSWKSFMGAYMLIVPALILIILRLFIPTVESTTGTLAVVTEGKHAVDSDLILWIEEIGEVKPVAGIEKMEQRLRGAGSVEGLYFDPENSQYVSVLERSAEWNHHFSLAARFIRQSAVRSRYPDHAAAITFSSQVPEELSQRTRTSPVASIGGSIFLIFMVIVNAFLIGLAVVNDKDYGTLLAIRLTPVTRSDYFIGRTLFPFMLLLVYTILALIMLKLLHVDILKLYLVVIFSFSITLFLGLLIGAVARNEVEAIGIGKLLSIVLLLSILAATLLPQNWHWVVWWSPVYWMFNLCEAVFTQSLSWLDLIWKTAVMTVSTALYFALFFRKIVRGLS